MENKKYWETEIGSKMKVYVLESKQHVELEVVGKSSWGHPVVRGQSGEIVTTQQAYLDQITGEVTMMCTETGCSGHCIGGPGCRYRDKSWEQEITCINQL